MLFWSATALAQAQPSTDRAAGAYAVIDGDPARQKAAFDAWFWGGETANAATYRSICNQPQDRDYAALCQQWRIAEAAAEAARWAWPQFALLAAGIVGLLVVLLFAARFAARAASAAGRAAAATEKYAQYELRPYISLKTIFEDLNTGPDGQPKEWLFSIEWQNTGSTPTKNMQSSIAARYFPGDIPENFDFTHPNPPAAYQGVIGAHMTGRSGTVAISLHDIDAMIRGDGKIYLWSRIDYNDVFDGTPRYHTAIAVEVYAQNPGIIRMGGVPFGFRPAKGGNHDS